VPRTARKCSSATCGQEAGRWFLQRGYVVAFALRRAFLGTRDVGGVFEGGGGKGDLEQPGPYDGDGHHLFFGPEGSLIWGPLFERYFAQQHISP